MDITFENGSARRAEFPCRACGEDRATHTLSLEGPSGTQYVYKCAACGSFYYDGADPVIGYDHGVNDTFWLDYVQAGAGITTMLAPLNALVPSPTGDLIDVGCGFGFVVDYWATRRRAAVGLESSYYGRVGREKLGIDIRPQHLDAFRDANPGRRFAVVYSSEVIEHTPDPRAFLEDLTLMLDEASILVLTTPSATAIDPASGRALLIAALSPGFHYAILSEQIMQRMLKDLGLHFRVETHHGQMIAWASRTALPRIEYGRSDWPAYFEYLEKLSGADDPHVELGALVRILKDGLNSDHPQLAEGAWDRLLPRANEVYGIDLLRPEIGELMEIRTPLAELHRYPSWLGSALLFGGLYVGHKFNDRRTKVRMLDAALAVLGRRADVDLQFGQEAQSFLPFAERQYVIALSEALTRSVPPPGVELEDDLQASLAVLREVIGRYLGRENEV